MPHGHFPCRGDDAWVALAVRRDSEWAALVELAAGTELAGHPEWTVVDGRLADVDAVESALAQWMATQDRDELVVALLSRGIAAAPVASYHDLITADWKDDRRLTVTVDHAYLGATEVFLVPWRFGSERHAAAAPGPILGSSTVPVLGELLGMPADEVERLQRDLVLR